MTRLIPLLIIVLGIAACKKDGSEPSLTGKWKQIEYFNTLPPGSCQCWIANDDIHANKLEFKSDGTYQQTPPIYSSVAYCLGTYRVVDDSTLSMVTGCTAPFIEELHWFSKQGNELIIAYKGPNFDFKLKFKKVRTF
jgi:hypothetical protein